MIGTGRTIGAHPRSRLARLGHGIWRLGFARPQPWTTWTLAAIVVGFFAVELHLGDPEQEIFLLHRLGSLRAPLLWAGDWHRLATSVFLHAGWTHFLMNLFGLFLFGFFVERRIGSRRTALLFATSALVGNAVFVQRRPWEYCVGASGALYGMVAVFVAYDSGLHARRPGELLFDRRFWFVSLMLFAFDVGAAEGLSLPIAPEAHWAGYGAGIAFGWLVLSEGRPRLRRVARPTRRSTVDSHSGWYMNWGQVIGDVPYRIATAVTPREMNPAARIDPALALGVRMSVGSRRWL